MLVPTVSDYQVLKLPRQNHKSSLAGGLKPSERYERQLGWWHSQYFWKNKSHVPNHQPEYLLIRMIAKSCTSWLLEFIPFFLSGFPWMELARHSEHRANTPMFYMKPIETSSIHNLGLKHIEKQQIPIYYIAWYNNVICKYIRYDKIMI